MVFKIPSANEQGNPLAFHCVPAKTIWTGWGGDFVPSVKNESLKPVRVTSTFSGGYR